MNLFIPKDTILNPVPPNVYLCNTSKTILGQLPAYEVSGNFKWNACSEISLSVDRTYTDVITGEQKIHPLFDKIDSPRNIYIQNIGFFSIQDVDTEYSDKDTKRITCFSYEYSTLGNKYLNNFKINAGTVDSVEVLYHEKQYGRDYVIDPDNMYTLAGGEYISDESYYIKEYVDKSYVWNQVQVNNAEDYATYFGSGINHRTPLYIKAYPNVRFYWESNQELSLLHLVLSGAPEWRIGHVDTSLWRKERKFEEDRKDAYSFLTNDIADTFKCVVVFDSIEGTVNFYEEVDDGLTEDGTIDPMWDTDALISRDNLASSIEVKYSADDIKTKLTLSSSEGVNVREVNLGSDYIMNLDFYHNEEWMEQDLFEAYSKYLEANKTYAPQYEQEMQNWVAANNKYHDVVHAVPAENDVVMIGDIFEKLYCMFGAINTAFVDPNVVNNISNATNIERLWYDENFAEEIKKADLSDGDMFVVQGYQYTYNSTTNKFVQGDNLADTTLLKALKDKLYIYQVDEDSKGTVQDNILLTLKNKESDSATIRIYAPKVVVDKTQGYDDNEHYYTREGNTEETYKYLEAKDVTGATFTNYPKTLYKSEYTVRCVIVRSKSGITDTPTEKSLSEWLKGNLTANALGLVSIDSETGKSTPDFTVKYIGTMGAYLVISKNEYVYTNDEWIPSADYLRQYGVKLLQEKANTYLKIFQTQTEAMYQEEGFQCVAQDTEPHGGRVPENTRWFKTSGTPTLYRRNDVASYDADKWGERWEVVTGVNDADSKNYQRYMDNYQKMVVTTEVLTEKERQSEYLLNGYAVSENPIDTENLNGPSLTEVMHRAAITHFCGTEAYSPNSITNSSQWDSLGDLYLNTYTENGVKKYINLIDKTTLPNGVRYVVNGYAYQYNAITEKFERKYRDVYITISALEQYNVTDVNGKVLEVCPLLPFTTAEQPFIKAEGTFDEGETYYAIDADGKYVVKSIAGIDEYETYDGKTQDTTLYIRNLYAVYLQGNIPYIAYYSSQGVYQMKKDYISKQTSIDKFFTEDQWIRLSPFIREDEFTNDNIITTEYDSEEEKLRIFKEFVEDAAKELKTLSQPSLEFSMTMANILALPEFAPLVDQFQLGKFVRVEINGDYSKRARLLEVNLNFDDLSDFSCVFGDLKTTKDQVDLHAELLAQAVQAGSTVAKGSPGWQSAVDKSNKLEESISQGLSDAALSVASSSGQSITWDQRGILGRKLVDGTTDQYEPEQFMLTNNKLVFTNTNWQSSKGVFGKFTVNGQERWGVLSDAVVSGYIQGSEIFGGRMEIGGEAGRFIVHENGSVEILGPDAKTPVYATQDEVDLINQATQYRTSLEYTGTTIFTEPGQTCTITCRVFNWDDEITDKLPTGTVFKWVRSSNASDTLWNNSHTYTDINTITITNEDIEKNAQFYCECTFDETKLS